MIEMRLAHIDLARVRFALSPVRELVASLLVLQDPARQCMHGGWLSAVRRQLGGLELELLTALAPIGHYLPSFLFPASAGPWGALAEELDVVAASPPAVVRADLDKVRQDRPLPAVLRPLYEDPAGQLPAVAEAMQQYWQAAVEPFWPRLRGVSTADLAYRMERFANGGLAGVLADLHPEVALDADRLQVDKPHHCVHLAVGGGGVLRGRPAHLDLPDAGGGRAVAGGIRRADRPAECAGGPNQSQAAGHPGPAQDHHPAGRPTRCQPAGGQPAPQGPQGQRAGQRATPRADGAVPADRGRHHPA
jgi:hypothetical protein